MIAFIIAKRQKNRWKITPVVTLEDVDENKSGLNEAVRNANQSNETFQIIKKYAFLLKRENKKMV